MASHHSTDYRKTSQARITAPQSEDIGNYPVSPRVRYPGTRQLSRVFHPCHIQMRSGERERRKANRSAARVPSLIHDHTRFVHEVCIAFRTAVPSHRVMRIVISEREEGLSYLKFFSGPFLLLTTTSTRENVFMLIVIGVAGRREWKNGLRSLELGAHKGMDRDWEERMMAIFARSYGI